MTRVLVLEPDAGVRERFSAWLADAGFTVEALADLPSEGLPSAAAFDVVAANPALPSGLDPVALMRPAPVILLARNATVADAVAGMRLGAADFLTQPDAAAQLIEAVQRALTGDRPRQAEACPTAWPLHGSCAAMLHLFARIRAAAAAAAPALIEGESGTGKELVARALHDGGRRNAPMITLNCLAIPEASIEAELFGYADAAATGRPEAGLVEAAHGGTLFLKEVGELPPGAQTRLLELLRTGESRPVNGTGGRPVDVRVVAATRRELAHLAGTGRFLPELLQGLSGVRLTVPPLRARGDDIRELAQLLAARAAAQLNKAPLHFSRAALTALTTYAWPGNVRELQNAVERAVILAEGDVIDAGLLPIDVALPEPRPAGDAAENGVSLEDYFVRFVTEHQDQLTETELATRLGISRKSLWERRKRHHIPRRRTRKRGRRRDSA